DEVVILEPWYENYVPDCRMAGAVPRFVKLHEPEYTFDPGELRAAFTNRTRLILINTPHNPTGRVSSRPELDVIAVLCREFAAVRSGWQPWTPRAFPTGSRRGPTTSWRISGGSTGRGATSRARNGRRTAPSPSTWPASSAWPSCPAQASTPAAPGARRGSALT